ncbi:MAG: tetratricopeptide repeat protein, partial [Luteolibacter sp.]
MKRLAPWIVSILIFSLFPSEAFARTISRDGGGGNARNAARSAPRNPVTNSRVNTAQRPAQRPTQVPQRPAQRPTQLPAQRPAQRPAQLPAQRPAQLPAQRPAQLPAQRPVQRPAQLPAQRPTQLPAQRPSQLPAQRPVERPGNRPVPRPEARPITRPETLPAIRPENRPVNRPSTLPATRPGNVTFPRPGDRPGASDLIRPGINRPGQITRPGGIDRPNIDLNNRPNLNVNNRPDIRPNRPGWGNEWGNWGDWNRNNNRPGFNNNNININTNINNNQNWSYRPSYWGSRPWWCSRRHSWYHGSWCHGWNRRNNGIFWGITAWSLGNVIFNSGYQVFVNPFPAPPIVTRSGTTIINYSAPITVVAGQLPPGEASLEEAADEQATDAMAASLAAFQKGDFAAALVSVDLALSKVPGDVAMHEFRALIFFALGRFDDSAGVLNAVLASGPGWDWTTMTGLFDSQETYIELLRKLEDYTDANPDSAAAHFVLGYHYLVLGHLEYALTLFDRVIVLEPRDTVSTQLRNLIKDAIVSDGEDAEEAPVPAKVDPDKLVGTWVSKRDEGTVKLVLTEDGKFTWTFDKGDK